MNAVPDFVLIPGHDMSMPLPEFIAELLSVASEVCLAIQHVRLHALQVVAPQLDGLRRCRITLAHLDVNTLDLSHTGAEPQVLALEQLLAFARSGRLEVRSAGAIRWHPDFSVFHLDRATPSTVCLLGAHYLAPLHKGIDWPLTCVLAQETAVGQAQHHFDSVWQRSHDALPAVIAELQRQQRERD